jgi:hypothetical protein
VLPLLLAACGLPEGNHPAPTLDSAAIEVLSALEVAVDRAGSDEPDAPEAAAAAVRRAVHRFEVSIEPVLRRTRPAREVLALEVGFAQVRAAVVAGRDPGPAVSELGERLRHAIEASGD